MTAKTRIIPALFLAAMLLPSAVRADTEGPYTYTVIGGQATITKFSDKSYAGSLTIANTLNGYSVIGIATNAFDGCSLMTGVTIPQSISSIGNQAFSGCSRLTSVTFLNDLSAFSAFDVFRGGGGDWYSKLKSITIGDTVTSIGANAFQNCIGLTNVIMGAGIKNIRSYAFYGCNSLSNLSIPAGVTSIGSSAFSGCNGLKSVTLLNNLDTFVATTVFGTTVAANLTNVIKGVSI